MIPLAEQHEAQIADWLQREIGQVAALGGGRWNLEVPGAGPLSASLRLDGDWLLLTASLGGLWGHRNLAGEALGRLLQVNALVAGSVKFALENGPRRLVLATEIPLDEETDLDSRLGDTFAGFVQAASAARSSVPPIAPAAVPLSAEDELAELCRQSRWPTADRSDGRLMMQLEVPDAFCQAAVERMEDDSVRLSAVLGVFGASALSQRAVEVLLLEGCRAVRMARATADGSDGSPSYRWEAPLGLRPGPPALEHALVALSLACRLTAREVQSLCDERLAQKYLEIRGWSS